MPDLMSFITKLWASPDRNRRLMRYLLLIAGIVGIGATAALLIILQRDPPERSTPLQARVELAAGSVGVDFGQGEIPIISGTPLRTDAKVRAGEGSRALIRLSDGTGLFLRGGTTLRFGQEGTFLEQGQMWMDAASADRQQSVHRLGEVKVTAAGAGLELTRTGQQVTVYVARGLATIDAPGGRAEIHAGERATILKNAIPKVSPVTFWEDWTGGLADHGSASGLSGVGAGTLYGVDFGGTAGSTAQALEISQQSIRAVIRDGLVETEVDQTFFNPGSRVVEGWYWFSIPLGAHVTGFALDSNGTLIEGELIERQEARRQYEQSVVAGHEPALLEWIDGHTFRARIFPVPAAGSRRAVLRYMQRLPLVEGRMRFVHPLQSRELQRIGEFALSVDLGAAGKNMEISTLEDARVEDGGQRVTMRRSGFQPLADFQLEARLKEPVAPLRVSRFKSDGNSADYLMARWIPDLDWNKVETGKAEVVIVVDTSGASDESSRQLRTATAEAVLRALSLEDRFALVSLDVKPTVLHPEKGLATASGKEISTALERLAGRIPEGATDLAAIFDVALARLHGAEQPAVIYVGDGWATSGELSGEALGERLRRALSTSRARFFTVAVGTDSNQTLLSELARLGGGQAFVVDDTEQAAERALRIAAAIKMPTITDLEIDFGAGLDELFLSANGKVSRGEEVMLLARTHHDFPAKAKVRGRLAGQPFTREYAVHFETAVAASLVPRLWAVEAIQRMLGTAVEPDAIRGKIISMGMEYGLMTPFTSYIALESEQAYQQRGIRRNRSRLQGARLSALTSLSASDDGVGPQLAGHAIGLIPFGCSFERPSEAPPTSLPLSAWSKNGKGTAEAEPMQEEMKRQVSPPAADSISPGVKGEFAEKSMVVARVREEPNRPPRPSLVGAAGGISKDEEVQRASKSMPRNVVEAGSRAYSLCSLMSIRSPCSDVSRRPLSERAVIWSRRLRTAENVQELVERYQAARAACELNDWRAQSRFLRLLQRQVKTPEEAAYLLGQFSCQSESRLFLARLLLRRTVDEMMIAAIQRALFENPVSWEQVDLELSAIIDPLKRLERLRAYVQRAPDDAQGIIRLCRTLVRAGLMEEALIHARRLRERGLMTPLLLREVGDLLTRQGHDEEAVRTYSEIVEFDPLSMISRRLLGDIYLGRGWYDAAYRQYRTLTELQPSDYEAWLRLASAAAGGGRLDEALRLERKVAEAEGMPGPDDPRRWARFWSAARLARIMSSPPKLEGDPARISEAMKRKLKELQLFQGPGSLVLVTWDDLAVDLTLVPGELVAGRGELVDAARVGLSGMLLPRIEEEKVTATARVRGGHRFGPIKLWRYDIEWDGKDFKARVREVDLPLDVDSVSL